MMRKQSRKVKAVKEIVFPMVQAIAWDEAMPKTVDGKNPRAVAPGTLRGLKGGRARASKNDGKRAE